MLPEYEEMVGQLYKSSASSYVNITSKVLIKLVVKLTCQTKFLVNMSHVTNFIMFFNLDFKISIGFPSELPLFSQPALLNIDFVILMNSSFHYQACCVK